MSEDRLREFEELVLLSVLIAAPEAYGASLQKILAEDAGRTVSLGAIYTALDRLARKGLVRSELGDPTPVRGGRRKRRKRRRGSGISRGSWSRLRIGSRTSPRDAMGPDQVRMPSTARKDNWNPKR